MELNQLYHLYSKLIMFEVILHMFIIIVLINKHVNTTGFLFIFSIKTVLNRGGINGMANSNPGS